jgi:hypothetical protein
MTDQFEQKVPLSKWSWRQTLGATVAILGPLTIVGFQAVTWLSGDTWPPLSLLLLFPKWLSGFLQLTWIIPPGHSGFHAHDIWIWFVTELMNLPLSVLVCVIGVLLIGWDEASAPSDGRPVT